MKKRTKKLILFIALAIIVSGAGLTYHFTRATGDSYTITYDANDSAIPCTADNIPDDTSASEGTTVSISSVIPTCSGYMFHSWKITTSGVTMFNDTNFRMPNKNVTITATWGKATITKSMEGTPSTMQDFSCHTINEGESFILQDTRENGINSYFVGKAADGNCWMLQNLRLGSSVTSGGSLTVDKANNTTGAVSGTFNLTGVVTDSFATNADGYNYDGSQFICFNDGCLYNWYTATAGSGTSSLDTGDADDSICPAGWTLPSSDQYNLLGSYYIRNNNDYSNFANAVDLKNTTGAIPGFTLNGVYSNGERRGVEEGGIYYTRHASNCGNNGNCIGIIVMSNTTGYTNSAYIGKAQGLSVRCISVR